MTELELNIANALITAKSALTEMIAQGLGDEQSLFVLIECHCRYLQLNARSSDNCNRTSTPASIAG